MTQEDICNVLKKAKRPLSIEEIHKKLADNNIFINRNNVSRCLRILRKHNEIRIIEIPLHEAKLKFNFKTEKKVFKPIPFYSNKL
jgi:Fe2+ or Zn2+ uptake regulation protein